jgi:hypothetical protein
MNYPEHIKGDTIPITIFVSDGLKTSSQTIQVKISDNFPPELILDLPSVYFDEDSNLQIPVVLSDFFLDSEGETLTYSFDPGIFNVTINEDLSINISAPSNWYGNDHITFRAMDDSGAIIEGRMLVVVLPVNDPPEISNIPKQEMKEGEAWSIDLSKYIYDLDGELYELEISVENEAGHEHIKLVGHSIIFEYPSDVYDDVITVTVSDGEAEHTRTFTASRKGPSTVLPSLWDVLPWLLLLVVVIVGTAIPINKIRTRYNVHEVFLLYEATVPIAHATKDESSDLDDAALGGMFTAVQSFITDAFADKTDDDTWELDEMAFGENKILIEREENLYLAVIFEGSSVRLHPKLKKILNDINEEYQEVLKDWDCDVSRLPKVKEKIEVLITSKKPTSEEDKPEKDKKEDTGHGHPIGHFISKGEMEEPGGEKDSEKKTDLWELPYPEERSQDMKSVDDDKKPREKEDKVLDLPSPKEQDGPTPISEHVLSGEDSPKDLPPPEDSEKKEAVDKKRKNKKGEDSEK